MHVEVKESTKTVVLHIKELLIKSATFTDKDGKSHEVSQYGYSSSNTV